MLSATRLFRRLVRRSHPKLAAAALGSLLVVGCEWDSDIFKRFREGAGPGLVEGATQSALNPLDPDPGNRRAWAAFWEGLGSVIAPRTGTQDR